MNPILIEYGTIQKDGMILEDGGNAHMLPVRGTDKEDYPEVLVDATEVGGKGFMYRQSVKQFIGMRVMFSRVKPDTDAYNHIILKPK